MRWRQIDGLTVALVILGSFLATFAFIARPSFLTAVGFGLIIVVEVTTVFNLMRMRYWEHDQLTAILLGERAMMTICPFCDEIVRPDDKPGTPVFVNGIQRVTHNECALRSVLGGIGHLTNHAYWCLQMHDPDAGLTFRESALQAWEWFEERGQTISEEEWRQQNE